jgi:rhodanese-related sulfurtransferase
MRSIDVRELARMQQESCIDLIDVRTPVEFRQLHAVGATNIPIDVLGLENIRGARSGRSDDPLYVICASGQRSRRSIQKLTKLGIDNVVNVDGGTSAWEQAGLPVIRGQRTLALPQQMQIAAGTMVTTGFVLGMGVHPAFNLLSVAVGLGLIFAGLTGYCPLSSLIARMPWNQCESQANCCLG